MLFHRPPHQDLGLLQPLPHLMRGLAHVEAVRQLHEIEAGHGLVDDHAHGTFLRMRTQEHHTFMEGGLRHAGHGNQ